jgi:penicillin-binding protein 2
VTPTEQQAQSLATAYLSAWSHQDYTDMWSLLTPASQAATGEERFVGIHTQFDSLTRVTRLSPYVGSLEPVVLNAAAGSGVPSASATTAEPSGASASGAIQGPTFGMRVQIRLIFTTDLFGTVDLDRALILVAQDQSWRVDWTSSVLFTELGANGTLSVTRQQSPRGAIVARDGTVFATNRKPDGLRVYPQESLAGQTIGYVGKITADDLKTLAAKGYRAGDWVGRSGLELGAEDLLRGTPGFRLFATRPGADPVQLLSKEMTPGATLTISLVPSLQRAAEAAMRRYPRISSAVINPRNGDIWVLASLPAFDPNAMVSGRTMRGVPLARPTSEQIRNKATLGTYPAGSDFKPFTLGAALQTKTVTTSTRMLCPGTWTFEGFTFQNWMKETLPGFRTWFDTMALSCNTTYMPLSVRVYDRDRTALTDLLHDFGFGEVTGVPYLPEAQGRLPDATYFETHKRWNGVISPYGPFDQIQLAIGQGEYVGTPLQLATAYAAWGNRGTLWQPQIVVSAKQPDGTVVYQSHPTVHHKIGLSKPVMDFVVSTMRAVVTSPLGTATRAFAGFPIAAAGKSGTAETGGPDPDAWFPAFAPMTNPTIAVATVVVTVPLGTGGDFAAPITRRIMEAYFFH